MKRTIILFSLVFATNCCFGQYNRDKLTNLLTGGSERTWAVQGVNADRPEKKFSFNKNYTIKIEENAGNIRDDKWSLNSKDEIRWFITIGKDSYELIVSYDKKGKEYVKLTHQSDTKNSGYYEIKLTQTEGKNQNEKQKDAKKENKKEDHDDKHQNKNKNKK